MTIIKFENSKKVIVGTETQVNFHILPFKFFVIFEYGKLGNRETCTVCTVCSIYSMYSVQYM